MGSDDLSDEWRSSGWMRFLPQGVSLAIMGASAGADTGWLLDEHWLAGEDEAVEIAAGLVEAGDPGAVEELAFVTEKRDDLVAWWGSEGWLSVRDALGTLQARGWLDDTFRWCTGVLPHEVLALSPAQRAREDELRWEDAFYRHSQRVIGLFDPDGERLVTWVGTLEQLASTLQLDPETVRSALAVLVGEGDFSVAPDLATARCDVELTVTVDWDLFDETRLTIST